MWAQKVKVVHFGRKVTHTVSLGCWFLFRHYFCQFPFLNRFLGKFGPKSQSGSFCLIIGIHSISGILILIPILVFWIFKPKSSFGKIWAEKVEALCFAWKLAHTHTHTPTHTQKHIHTYAHIYTHSISRMLILISILIFSNFKPKSRWCWFLFWD